MTACREILELLSTSLDQALSPEEQTRLDSHLTECPDCRSAQKEFQWIHSKLKGLEAVEPPPWLASKIMARIRSEAAPQASFWRRFILPIVMRPQLQVASILLLAATGFYLLRTQRSQGDVFGEIKQQRAPAPMQSQPRKSEEARDKLAQVPRNAPREMRSLRSEGMDQLRLEESKPSELGFAPPPKTAAPPMQSAPAMPAVSAMAKQERDRAQPELPLPLEAPKPSPMAGASVGSVVSSVAESASAPPRQAKKSSKGAEDLARTNRADEEAKEKITESTGQLMDQGGQKDKSDATTWVIRLNMPDPLQAKPLIERELARTGATVMPQRESDASRVLKARLDPRRLSDLLTRLARIGKVLEQPDMPVDKPSRITISIHW